MENEKLSPYKQVALEALQSWFEMSYNEALAEVKECTTPEKIAEMDEKIDAKYSMDAAIHGLCNMLGYRFSQLETNMYVVKQGKEAIEEKKKSVFAFMYRKLIKNMEKETEYYLRTAEKYGDADKDLPIYKEIFDLPQNEDKDIIEYISEAVYGEKDISQFEKLLKELNLDENELVIDVLDHVHYEWIEKADKQGKFLNPKREKTRFQFSNSWLIGFEELKKDLLFAKPILDRLGIEYTEEGIKEAYERKVREFMEGIESKEDLKSYIMDTSNRSLNRKDLEENERRRLEAQTDPEVAKQIVEQILEHNPLISDIITEKENKKETESLKKISLWDKIRAIFVKKNDTTETTKSSATRKDNDFRENLKYETDGKGNAETTDNNEQDKVEENVLKQEDETRED